jgi:hypothetical protein
MKAARRCGPQKLPRRVVLPDTPLIGAAHLRDCLGVSKALLHRWRSLFGFPVSFREGRESYTLTDAVATWLKARGVLVNR